MGDRHYPALDGLRGIAALMVLALHIGQLFPSCGPFAAGYLGVDLFFVVSGVVIGASYEERLAIGALSVRSYAVRRLRRLYPMLLLGVTLGIAVLPLEAARPYHLAVRIPAALLLVPTFWWPGHVFALNPPQWSLMFELAANFLHATVVRQLSTFRLAMIVALSAAVYAAVIWFGGTAAVGAGMNDLAAGVPRVSAGFFAGLLLFRCRKRLPRWPVAGWLALPLLVVALVAAGYDRSPFADLAVVLLAIPACVGLALGADAYGPLDRLSRFAGEVSYPVYAVQAPAIILGAWWMGAHPSSTWSAICAWSAYGAGIILVGHAVGRVIDRPVRNWLAGRRPARFAAPAASLP